MQLEVLGRGRRTCKFRRKADALADGQCAHRRTIGTKWKSSRWASSVSETRTRGTAISCDDTLTSLPVTSSIGRPFSIPCRYVTSLISIPPEFTFTPNVEHSADDCGQSVWISWRNRRPIQPMRTSSPARPVHPAMSPILSAHERRGAPIGGATIARVSRRSRSKVLPLQSQRRPAPRWLKGYVPVRAPPDAKYVHIWENTGLATPENSRHPWCSEFRTADR